MTAVLYQNKMAPQILDRKAIVYLRQSFESQVQQNTESRRLQYALADDDPVYDLGFIDDLLVLGIKATTSVVELKMLLQQGTVEKARHRDLARVLPPGYARESTEKVGQDANARVSEASDLVVRKLRELRSVRQTLLWLHTHEVQVYVSDERPMEVRRRIVRIVVEEVIANVDEPGERLCLVVQWKGAPHTPLEMAKPGMRSVHKTALSDPTDIDACAPLCLARLLAPLRALTLDPSPSGDILSRVPKTERSTSHETAHVRLRRRAAARNTTRPQRKDPGGVDRRDRPRHPGRSPRRRNST